MSRKVKKQASSMSFSISRWFRKISSSKPSSMTFIVVVVAFSVFLCGGGLLTIITRPDVAVYTQQGRFLFLYPALDGQFVMDTFLSATLYAIGVIGLLLIYRSTKNAFKPRQAYMGMIVGASLVLLAYIFLEGSIIAKLQGI
jgi:predicted neutral ceramidase superfamily lipid hydrolase